MSLLVKADIGASLMAEVTPASAGWTHVGFQARRLAAGEELALAIPAGREACLVILSGLLDVSSGGIHWSGLGGRSNVFEDRSPEAVYAPPGSELRLWARTEVELGVATAPGEGRYPLRVITAVEIRASLRGEGANRRYVRDILPQTEPAESLLVVEVITPAGHSSSYPPHKHDTDNLPDESSLEETYYHRIDPPQGFALQRVYTEARDLDETMAVADHDVVMVPRGYHPVVMPHGYRGYYLNVMAGPRREWHFHNDPDHEWLVQH